MRRFNPEPQAEALHDIVINKSFTPSRTPELDIDGIKQGMPGITPAK